jgi:hypothetical protein
VPVLEGEGLKLLLAKGQDKETQLLRCAYIGGDIVQLHCAVACRTRSGDQRSC